MCTIPLEYTAYEVVFTEKKLGMVTEPRPATVSDGTEDQDSVAVVMTIDNGHADKLGVTVGSRLVEVDGISVLDMPYVVALAKVKNAPAHCTAC